MRKRYFQEKKERVRVWESGVGGWDGQREIKKKSK